MTIFLWDTTNCANHAGYNLNTLPCLYLVTANTSSKKILRLCESSGAFSFLRGKETNSVTQRTNRQHVMILVPLTFREAGIRSTSIICIYFFILKHGRRLESDRSLRSTVCPIWLSVWILIARAMGKLIGCILFRWGSEISAAFQNSFL